MSDPVPNVYACIASVSAEIAKAGIAKDSRNAQQGYAFRGIDAVMNVLAPLLPKHGLVILPRMLARAMVERATQKGGTLFCVTVEMEFDFVSTADGSTHVVRMYGEAMDSADKATNKSATAAYKYACFQAFCIPIEGEKDADATTPEETVAKAPDGYDEWRLDYLACADTGLDPLRKMFKTAPPAFREYLTKHDGLLYDVAVKNAEAASKKAKQQPDTVPA